MFGEKYTAWQDKNRGLLDRLGVLGVGISQLSAGQAPDISGAWQSVQARRDERKLGESMRNPALLAQFSPEQQKMLSTMPPQLAQQLIMEKVFAPPPAPVKPDWQQFDGSMYDMNAPGGPSVAIAGTNPADAKAAETAAERTQREADAAKLGYAPGSPEFNGYVVTGDLAPKPDVPKPTDDMQEYDFYSKQATGAGMKPLLFDDWMRRPKDSATNTEYGLQPIYGRDASGNLVVMQLSKDGTMVQTKAPNGINPDFQTVPYNKARSAAEGKAAGEDTASFDSLSSKMPGLRDVVTNLDGLAGRATYTYAGQALDAGMKQIGMEPRNAAVARAEYVAVVDNQVLPLLRDTFGAAFTVKEGETLRATLGDPNKSPKEKQVVLRAFIDQKERDVSALKARTGSKGGASSGVPEGVTPEEWDAMPPEDKAQFQ